MSPQVPPQPPPMRAVVNNGDPVLVVDLTVDVEQIEVMTMTEPDPTWEHVDPAGHYHARTKDGGYPTLHTHSEHVDCTDPGGDDCDGYDITTYHCIVCDAEVKPGSRPTTFRKYIPGRETWSVEVEQHVPDGERVSVVIDTGEGRRCFGFAVPIGFQAEGGPDGVRVRTRLAGASPLGRR